MNLHEFQAKEILSSYGVNIQRGIVTSSLKDVNSIAKNLQKITNTKFIIITHHALTMSRMDRLYGVTMAEQGVSQLVSVDLERAEELVA